MIALLRGKVSRRDLGSIVVDVNGVGYEVACTVRTLADIKLGEEIELQIHTSVSDDAIRLYGFISFEELRLFRLLIGVERIGPKAALAILGRAELTVLTRAIAEGDAALLATVPGVGRKTADRVVLELSGKLDWIPSSAKPGAVIEPILATTSAESAVIALVGLGFRDEEARRAVSTCGDEEDDVSAIIAAALRQLDTVKA